MSYRFRRAMRLQHALEYQRVYDSKSFAADDVLVVNGCRNDTDVTRLGLSVSRAVGNAVVRNRWKRWIREAFRQSRLNLPQGFDFVVRPKRGAAADYARIRDSLPRLTALIARKCSRERI